MSDMSAKVSKGKILIVDDVSDNLTFLRGMLSPHGYQVRSASNGDLAIQSALAEPPDLILLDILMPGMNGYDVCQVLKSHAETRDIPIIFVSALNNSVDKVKAFSVGGADYLAKPIEPLEAIARIEHQLNLCQLQAQLMAKNAQLEQEIQTRKQAEAALNLSLREASDIKFALDQSAIVAITDLQGRLTYVNDNFCSISKYSRSELLGKTHRIVNSGYHPKEFFRQMWQTICQAEVWKGEICNRAKDGTFYWVDTVIVPMLGPDGVPYQYVSIRQDMSDRNRTTLDKLRARLADWHRLQAEEQLRLLQSVVINANDAVVITDAKTINAPGPEIIYVNQAFTRITGYHAHEIIGKTPRVLQGPSTNPETLAEIRAALEVWKPVRAELINYTKQRKEFWAELNITPLHDEDGVVTHWISIQRDISQRKKEELTLQRQAQIIDQIHDSILTLNRQGMITSWNQGAEQRFGYSAQDILGKHVTQLFQAVDPHSFQTQVIQPLLQKGEHVLDTELLTHAQDCFPAHLSFSAITNKKGKMVGIIGYAIDISERKRAEAEILKSLAKERELNELKTRFVSMVSHEYRTPLATILSSLELLEHYGHRSSEADKSEFFQQIRTAVHRMTDLLNDVLTLNKSESGLIEFNPAPLNVASFCKDLVTELQRNIKTHQKILLSLSQPIIQGQLDQKLLRHIFANLLSNAVKYSPKEGIIKFDVTCQDQSVMFTVQDQGIGIPPEAMKKLFHSFFRANNVGNIAGTGLGLSIVKRSVDIHHGSIRVESQVGVGSTFKVVLPLQ